MSENVTETAPVTTQAESEGKGLPATEAVKGEAPAAEAVTDPAKESEVVAETKIPEAEASLVPEKYEFKLPEGLAPDAKHLAEIESFAKAHKLTNAQAQAQLEREIAAKAGFVEAQKADLKKASDGWVEAAKADAEIGGDKLSKSVELSRRVMSKFGSEKLINALDETGLGNNPELIRLLSRIGAQMSDDSLVHGGKTPPQPKRAADIFYPDMKKE
jgi:hypothetical protein